MQPFNDLGLLALRVFPGLTMLFLHGYGKLMNFKNIAPNFPDPIGLGGQVSLGLAVFGEVVCPIALIVGFKTRLAAVPALITMLVAAFIVHAPDPWKKKELAIMYAVVYLTLILCGSGKYSVDGLTKKKF